jgi:hypothetical protein
MIKGQGFIQKAIALIVAMIFMQMPQFIFQYHLLLKGHLTELNNQINKLESLAIINDKTLEQYAEKFLKSADNDFHNMGLFIKQLIERQKYLAGIIDSLLSANALTKPFIFIKTLDFSIFKETFMYFKPGFIFTIETVGYGFAGFLLFFSLYAQIQKLFKRRFVYE